MVTLFLDIVEMTFIIYHNICVCLFDDIINSIGSVSMFRYDLEKLYKTIISFEKEKRR